MVVLKVKLFLVTQCAFLLGWCPIKFAVFVSNAYLAHVDDFLLELCLHYKLETLN